MASGYPTSLDDFTNPTTSDALNASGVPHATQHSDANDAIENLQAKMGIDSSAVTTSHDYKLSGVTGSDKAASLTGTETFTNKTLTAPAITNPTLTVDTISEFTGANGVTIDSLNIKDGKLNTNDSVTTANITDKAVTAAKLDDGMVLQIVKTQTGSVATGTTTIATDDTIPQITEGDEYMTLAITPKATSNVLIIDIQAVLANSASTNISGAIFQDSTTDALAGVVELPTTANGNITMRFQHTMTAGTTSATTFRLRAGGSAAGTTTFNGSAGARRFGGVMASSIVITEYRAA